MGRNIYWRAAVKASLILVLIGQLHAPMAALANGNPDADEPELPPHGALKPLMGTPLGVKLSLTYSPLYLKAMQGHASPKSWTDGMTEAIVKRHEMSYWIGQWLSDNKLKRFVNAQNRYFEFRSEVDTILRNAGMPWEIISIPVVESSWKFGAVSKSNAVGPWQFMEASGRGRDLIIDSWRDERRGIWHSTEAATKELKFGYKLFNDWFLAMAAYNAGPTRLRKLKAEGDYSTFWDMMDKDILPLETRDYVPQIIAVSYIQSHAGRLGLPINWDPPTDWIHVPLPQPVNLDDLTDKLGVDRQLFLLANMELNQIITPPGTYTLKIPLGNSTSEEITEIIQEAGLGKDRFLKYLVHSGDTMSGIAKQFDLPIQAILDFNSRTGTSLRTGERLYIPVGADYIDNQNEILPDWKGLYKVQPGDSLWGIARRFGISPEMLAEVNYRSITGVLGVGSVLRVPGDSS